jgi:hypothetical protein
LASSKNRWTDDYTLPTSEVLVALKKGILVRVLDSRKSGQLLTAVLDRDIISVVEEYRLLLSLTNESDPGFEQLKETTRIIQNEAERRGYTFVCACGGRSFRRVEKKAVCYKCDRKPALQKPQRKRAS